MRQQFPDLQVAGTYTPPFRPLTSDEVLEVRDAINDTNPDIVWVGLGCPKQERWMGQFRPLLDAPLLIGVGAGFDFLSGNKNWAPRWVQHSGLEWFYRTLQEPRRLGRRYARVVPYFMWLAVGELIRSAAGRTRQ